MTLFIRPMTASAAHTPALAGTDCPVSSRAGHRRSAATPTRSSMMVSGGNPSTATLMKKNEPPHSTESTSSSAHSVPPITLFTAWSPVA